MFLKQAYLTRAFSSCRRGGLGLGETSDSESKGICSHRSKSQAKHVQAQSEMAKLVADAKVFGEALACW